MIPAVVSTGALVAGIGHIAWLRWRHTKARNDAQVADRQARVREELRCQTLAHAIRERERAQRVQIVGELDDRIPCDQCGELTGDPSTCPHGREICPECLEYNDCKACLAERNPR